MGLTNEVMVGKNFVEGFERAVVEYMCWYAFVQGN